MSQAEDPSRSDAEHTVTIDDVRTLMGASTPHFALQLRNRIAALIKDLPEGDPARALGEQEIARLQQVAVSGEVRGHRPESGLAPLASVTSSDGPGASG